MGIVIFKYEYVYNIKKKLKIFIYDCIKKCVKLYVVVL